MTGFEKIRFSGKFRDYQQRVLDNSREYLKDGKINIVAAPGSGKTVLGLELIRRLGSPCIVFSPTTAIRQQWGERFRDLFLEDKEDFPALFSFDLHHIKLINSVTYQALYTAIEKIPEDYGEDIDCSDIDIFAAMKSFGIRTVCLDEAHHLKNEWQKALEKFIAALDSNVKIISLTATPPYDSEGAEWSRYQKICGEIDEEIFVPELVAQNSLCPHQDYVFFNYPSESEVESFASHKERAALALNELGQLELFRRLRQRLSRERNYEALFSSVKEYIAVLTLLQHFGQKVSDGLIRELTGKKGLPAFNMQYAERGIQFLLDGELISEDEKSQIISILKKNSVYEKRKATLELSEKLKRSLISSVGKLESIKRIARSEIAAMGPKLRMLVLTDYIKKESLSKIASSETFSSVNVVSIFESLRRDNPGVDIGVLSGTLVILPKSIELAGIKHKKEDIPGTDYCTVEFSGSTHRAVEQLGKLFEEGKIQILVGTKSLLGEGWDSPCINSLILASFVGSFVLSNQMRGRAIRIDKNDPDKTANIWHLLTVEPEYLFKETAAEQLFARIKTDHNELASYDYEILKRRFESFMGPNYTSGAIESGIERITAIRAPFDKAGIERINTEMLALSARRGEVKDKWHNELCEESFDVAIETDIPKEKRVPVFSFWNVGLSAVLLVAEVLLLRAMLGGLASASSFVSLLSMAAFAVLLVLLFRRLRKIFIHSSPANSIKTLGIAVYKTLRECGLISPSARVVTSADKELNHISLYLRNASIHDQNIFNTAMTEMLSPIDNPRYILISRSAIGSYNYSLSFACPSIIGRKKEYVILLAKKLKGSTGNFEPVYTHREGGRSLILKCRKSSYISFNEKALGKKYTVSHWD